MTSRVAARWVGRLSKGREIVYMAVFLPPMERARLLKKFGKTHQVLVAHHMTIWFQDDGDSQDLKTLPFGKTVPLKIIGHAEDGKVQAVVVKPPSNLRPKGGRVPHITISTAPGTTPKQANDLLADPSVIVFESGLPTIGGKVGWWDGEKERFDIPE